MYCILKEVITQVDYKGTKREKKYTSRLQQRREKVCKTLFIHYLCTKFPIKSITSSSIQDL